ncbi:putative methyltransferase [Chionoecetes opilio]|uniref:Putative methyltransferase n=1 Tax=Chionoecetes opilio TaxID=41210 RepID=A0A8J4XXX8_CHIOP|nr:putative methyltransferase [Chionoecetes opilio]
MSQRYFEEAPLATTYAMVRPEPPASLVQRVLDYLRGGYGGPLEAALDVGCGSGQSTHSLAPHFVSVTGLDISEAQVAEALKLNKNPAVAFRVSGAESLPFPDGSQQLVTAGQACHWFDLPRFFKEVDRVLVPGGVVALYCYDVERIVHHRLAEKLNAAIDEVYHEVLAGCWGQGIKDVEDMYQDPRFALAYPDSCRDETHLLEREVSVVEVTLMIASLSGFNTYREKNGEPAAQKVLDDFQKKFMSTLGVTSPPEDTRIKVCNKFLLILGRKPSA